MGEPVKIVDYDPGWPGESGEVKRRCADRFRDERQKYVEAKEPYVWDILRRADTWAQDVGSGAGPSDA